MQVFNKIDEDSTKLQNR